MRDILGEIIGIILIVLALVLFCLIVMKFVTDHDDKLWNSGHCDNCGGNWTYEQAVGHRTSTTYIYICDGCGKRIEISEMR